MTRECQRSGFDADSADFVRGVRLLAASLACSLVVASAYAQQQNLVPPQQQQDPAEPAPGPARAPAPGAAPGVPAPEAELAPEEAPPSFRPGFIDALGRWLGDSKAAIDSQFRSTQDTIGTWGSQARDAAGNVVAIPETRVIAGRQLCPTASNGAPDCQQGTDALCRTKGFQTGRSLDVTSAQRCPAKVWISGRAPKEGECRMETYVTRAVCQ